MNYWLVKIIEWLKGRTFKRFYHSTGFADDTMYIEFKKGVATCVSVFGEKTQNKMTLKFLEGMVRDGFYKEKP